jgi:hypothetical protein
VVSPWWFVYQPVSYRLNSRHGDVNALRSMITTCRANGVRIYADAVVNHMVRCPVSLRPILMTPREIPERWRERYPQPSKLGQW